ncbi:MULTISPECIES: hypothetical protein [Pseudomonas]|uniref:Uncharacterized protein n=1 Tax=Pseudomonas rustica TaxID=2827099 RepID=A0ABS5N6L1_9PSED|nr:MULTISPECIES: hypothetical protein [Pseudomonas]MBS4081876.1 hypothetical protein [Pseudomonas rustica]
MNLSAENIGKIRDLVRSGYPLKTRDAKDLQGHNDHLIELLEARGRLMLGVEIERDQLRAEIAGLKTGYEAYEQVNAELKAEVEGLRATADLQKLLPEVSDALEELELHGLHSDQGYRKLKDWHRKVGLAYRVIQGPMFGAEHSELVSQNTWLRSVVEHYAQQHAPLEPLPDMEGWSARLPGYDLPSLLRDAERYRRARDIACRVRASVGFHLVVQLPSPSGSSFCAAKAFDEAIDAALGQGEQS